MGTAELPSEELVNGSGYDLEYQNAQKD